MDCAAASAALALPGDDTGVSSSFTSQQGEAWELAFPGKDPSWVSTLEPDQLGGVLSAWKGKYFEVLVRDRLNAGDPVGDLQLVPGQSAELAADLSQPGWDLRIVDESGGDAYELIQLKATDSLGYVKEALERYPDINVLATEELSGAPAEFAGRLAAADISDAEIETSLLEPLQALQEGVHALDLLPGLPFVLILMGEGGRYLFGKQTFRAAARHSLRRSKNTALAMVAGGLVGAATTGLLGSLAAFSVRLALSERDCIDRSVATLEGLKVDLNPLLRRYAHTRMNLQTESAYMAE